jgi:streptogramin lyase
MMMCGVLGLIAAGSARAQNQEETPGKTIIEWAAPGSPLGIAVNEDGRPWWAISDTDQLEFSHRDGSNAVIYSGLTAGALPAEVALADENNVWFTEANIGAIGHLAVTTKVVTEYFLSDSGDVPFGIALGGDGNLWFTEEQGNKIGQITTKGVITEFFIPTAGAGPRDIVAGSDGNLWFTEHDVDQIGMITTAGVITEFLVTAGSSPNGIASGKDGNLWYTEQTGNAIGKILVKSPNTVTDYSLPTSAANPGGITNAGDGNLWFVESDANNIASITTAGKIAEYPLKTANCGAVFIAASTQRPEVFVTETGAGKISRIAVGDNDDQQDPQE